MLKTVLWRLEKRLWWLWWRLSRPIRRLRRRFRNCGHPCCVNRPKGVPHPDLPEGECPCLDNYRSLLHEYVQLYKERETERETAEFWKNHRK